VNDQPEFDLNAIRAAIRPAVLTDDLFEACRIMETAAGIEEPLLPRLLPQMSSKLAIIWELFYEPEDRAESLRYWLVAERLWPMLKINGKEISQVPG
jgi:hypothetical protein